MKTNVTMSADKMSGTYAGVIGLCGRGKRTGRDVIDFQSETRKLETGISFWTVQRDSKCTGLYTRRVTRYVLLIRTALTTLFTWICFWAQWKFPTPKSVTRCRCTTLVIRKAGEGNSQWICGHVDVHVQCPKTYPNLFWNDVLNVWPLLTRSIHFSLFGRRNTPTSHHVNVPTTRLYHQPTWWL